MMALNARISGFLYKKLNSLPLLLQHTVIAILTCIRDPKPEMPSAGHQEAGQTGMLGWGWFPVLTLTSAWGVLSVAYADITSRYTTTGTSIFFWLGLAFICVPSTVRLISPAASRFERISLLCVVGICLYVVKVMYSPLSFSGYDEFLHWLTADNIIRTGHLFSENTLLPVSPDYPGLEIVTNALSTISGLSTFNAGVIVIGVARLVMILSLFLLNEQIMKSARIAGIATIIYVANPHFLIFDAQFSYESLALPLATFMIFVMACHETKQTGRHWITLSAWIALAGVVVTHHLTDFIFVGLLVLWTLAYAFLHPAPMRQSNLVQTALFGVFITVVYVLLIASPVVLYLSSFLGSAFNEIKLVLIDRNSARQLFVDYGGDPTPLWERILSLSSVVLITLSLPFGLLCLWQRYRSNALAYIFGFVSLFYPVTLVLRFTSAGGEIADRTSAFLFIPLSCVLAVFITQFWPTRLLRWKQITLLTCAITVMFLGGAIVGGGPPWALLPGGQYLVSADAHSIEPKGIQAALWTRSYLGPNNRVATDRINQLLMSTYGEQREVTGLADNIDVTTIFFSPSLGPNEISILQRANIRYLIVDLRLAHGLPRVGFYFEPGEPGSYHRTAPIDQAALTKFDTVPLINRIFDSGDLIIYDMEGLINAP